jgi:pimeloyl-ACP methyl ester carboxylesterase
MPNLTVRGLSLHVQRLGPDPVQGVVVMLHGLVMDNLSSLYFTLAGPVSQDFHVVLTDLRGHGLSQRPPAGYGLLELTDDLECTLDALGLGGPVHLVGHSFGGVLALSFASRNPARVASVVLLDGHVGSLGWGARMAATLRLTGEAQEQTIAQRFEHWLGRSSARKTSRLVETARALVEGTSLVADLEASPALDLAPLAAANLPVFALYGERSDLRDEAEALTARLPSATLELLPGASHSILWERTDAVRERVRAWLLSRRPHAP